MFYMRSLLAAVMVALLFVPCAAQKAKPKPEPKPAAAAYTREDIEKRIAAALEWLVDHQSSDGSFSAKDFSKATKRLRAKRTHNLQWVKPGDATGDAGTHPAADGVCTALALLAFIATGSDHREGPYKKEVALAANHLRGLQHENGCFGEPDEVAVFSKHAVITQALAELFALSQDAELKPVVEKAARFILEAQNPDAGWRYGIKPGDSDVQVTGSMLLALKSCSMAQIGVDLAPSFDAAAKYLESMTVDVGGVPTTGYMQPGTGWGRSRDGAKWESQPTGNAVNICCMMFMGRKGWDAKHKTVIAQAKSLTDKLPAWGEFKVDYEYWYWATLAAYQVGAKTYETWSAGLLAALMPNQRGWRPEDKDSFEAILDEHGSFDAVDAWYGFGGRVYSTAITCLALQIHARYLRINSKGK